jgi:exonuclease V gamma subunit
VTWLLGRRKGGRGATITKFATVENPGPIVLELVRLLEAGLRWPVPFFPDSSFEFVAKLAKSDVAQALSACSATWRTDVNQSATLQRIYGLHINPASIPVPVVPNGEDDSTWRFEIVAPRIYGPMLAHMADVS